MFLRAFFLMNFSLFLVMIDDFLGVFFRDFDFFRSFFSDIFALYFFLLWQALTIFGGSGVDFSDFLVIFCPHCRQ